MVSPPAIFVLTGTPGVGKSSIAKALLRRFPRGLVIPVDDLREWVVSGLAGPSPWTDETSRQFALAEHSAVDLALRYAQAGFTVAIDHCQSWYVIDERIGDRLDGFDVHRIGLHTSLDTALARNAARDKGFDRSVLVGVIEYLHPIFEKELAEAPDTWTIVNSDGLTLDETVDRILAVAGSG